MAVIPLVVTSAYLVSAVRPAGAVGVYTDGQGWPTYHHDNSRNGVDTSVASATNPVSSWTFSGVDGNIYAEPLVYDGLVFVATENDSVYAVNATTGELWWSTHLGNPVPQSSLPCGDIFPLGITGTPVIDPSQGEIFVVAEELNGPGVQHVLYGLDLASGEVRMVRDVDPSGMDPVVQQQRAALAIDQGSVLVSFGGLDGDCGDYHGWVVGASETNAATPLLSYAVGVSEGVAGASQGAIWATSGPSIDASGNVYVGTGNGANSAPPYDYGDSVVKLSPPAQGLSDISFFQPTQWATWNHDDADLGSAGPLLIDQAPSVPNDILFQMGKQQIGFLLDAGNLAAGTPGAGLFSATGCPAQSKGGDAYLAPYIYAPCDAGLQSLRLTTGSSPTFATNSSWTVPGADGSPIVAGGRVWVINTGAGTLYGLDPTTGLVRNTLSIGTAAHFASPAAGDTLLVAAGLTSVHAWSFGGSPPPAPQPPPGHGYWLVASDGGIFTYGDAGFYGSAGAIPLNRPVVGMAATPDGHGYWLVASDGGIFTYGDAGFYGSAGAIPLNRPVVGMAATPDGHGYWLVASDGGIFTYGDAGFYGSAGAIPLNRPVVGMAATPDGHGYWLVASDGGIFTYGDAGFYGSAGALPLNRPVVGMASR
jgi:outer membrane protein assembly factor BamB